MPKLTDGFFTRGSSGAHSRQHAVCKLQHVAIVWTACTLALQLRITQVGNQGRGREAMDVLRKGVVISMSTLTDITAALAYLINSWNRLNRNCLIAFDQPMHTNHVNSVFT